MNERIAVTQNPMRLVWDERGEADGRPWTINAKGDLHDWWCRYKPESVRELTHEPKMVVDYTNIREVLDFMGVPEGQFEFLEPKPRTRVHPSVELGRGSTVWKFKNSCYILGPHTSVFQVWTVPAKTIEEEESP